MKEGVQCTVNKMEDPTQIIFINDDEDKNQKAKDSSNAIIKNSTFVIIAIVLGAFLIGTNVGLNFKDEKNIAARTLEGEERNMVGLLPLKEEEKTSTLVGEEEGQDVTLDKNNEERKEQLIQFAVAGFEKCGTTFLMKSLHEHPEVFMGFNGDRAHEIHVLKYGRKKAVEKFKSIYENHDDTINGFKAPEVLFSNTIMRNMVDYFQHVDFILSTRHPILFFQSLYNFKYRSKKFKGNKRPDPLKLMDDCHNRKVCTSRALFHDGLARLMLTPSNTTDELELLDHPDWSKFPKFKGRIFLTEIGQLADKNETRVAELSRGIEGFLGLTPNTFDFAKTSGNKTKETYIEICEEKYEPLRATLLLIAQRASKWILNYLMKSPRVVVANREHLIELFEKWQTDPCKV